MSDTRWIALHCGEEAQALLENHPNAFLLLTQIAMRAKWKDCKITGLKAGEALIGDWKEAGLRSEGAYRHAKSILQTCQLATFQGATKGTRAKLVDSTIYSVSKDRNNGQNHTPATDEQRTNDGQATTNHTDTLTDGKTDTSKGGGSWELSLEVEEQKPKPKPKPKPNTDRMIRFGNIMDRRSKSKWSAEELRLLKEIEPVDEVDLVIMEEYYRAKEREGEKFYRRQKLVTLLGNWSGELDLARRWLFSKSEAFQDAVAEKIKSASA